MKILNAFAGHGGNRELWTDSQDQITAIEKNKLIADGYQERYPDDEVIVECAYTYIQKNYEKFDFIWCSPMCNRNSRFALYHEQALPDLRLYELIVFLDTHFHGQYCVENTISWFRPLIEPQRRGRHYLWTNFWLPEFNVDKQFINEMPKGHPDRQKVDPLLGKYVLDAAKDQVVTFPQHDATWIQQPFYFGDDNEKNGDGSIGYVP